MTIIHKSLPRRTFLRGMGVTVALPLLDAMTLFSTKAQAASKRPVRLGYMYKPNGAIGACAQSPRPFLWTPRTAGRGFEFTPTLKSLEPYREHLNVFSGLAQNQGWSLGSGGGDHARSTATFLTGVHPFKTGGADFKLGISADQIAAKTFSKYTQLASLELALEAQPIAGNCDSGYTCAYMSTSWRSATQPVPSEISPRAAFERLFGDGASTDPAARQARLQNDKSVLDYVMNSLTRLQRRIGADDTRKLDEYLESVRDIERRIQLAEKKSDSVDLPVLTLPVSTPPNYVEYAELMLDLLVAAWQSDMTRVSTFMLGRDGSNRPFPEIGVSDGHHSISHHQRRDENVEKLIKIDYLQTRMFAYLLKRLKETKDGEGTLLDNSLVVFGSGLSESNLHTHNDLPIVMAGTAGGRIQGGRHLVYPTDTPLNNLFLNMFDLAGAEGTNQFGDSTGRLTGV
ncbi:MAG: DUF1552 domain-containing protein [Steroidobacteraceae bacterium]